MTQGDDGLRTHFTLSISGLHIVLLAPLSNGLSTQSRKMAAQTPAIDVVRLRPSNKEKRLLFLIASIQILGFALIGPVWVTCTPEPIPMVR